MNQVLVGAVLQLCLTARLALSCEQTWRTTENQTSLLFRSLSRHVCREIS
jgi:hypothetical protein